LSVDPAGQQLVIDTGAGIASGTYLPLTGGSMTGPLNYTATGGTVARSAQDRAGDVANVLDFGADPTGVADSSAAFTQALAVRRNGIPADVYAPAGTYRINQPLPVGDQNHAQSLFGDGWSTVLLVGPAFSRSAPGVIVTVSGNKNYAQPAIHDLRIQFEQPPDLTTTTTAASAGGTTTITVANTAGILTGFYCRNIPNPNSMQFQSLMPKVVSIAGNVITLSQPHVGTVNAGETVSFACNRSQAVALSTNPTLSPAAAAIQYPWAIYAVSETVRIDHVLIGGAWNGVYIRGSTFDIGQYFVGCLNIGLDIDQCYNFPKMERFMLWGWGFDNSPAMFGVYYDGQTVAANIGRCDDFVCDTFQSWCGILNVTASWSWGAINRLSMDGSNSNLNIHAGGGGWLQLGNFYSTGGNDGVGIPLVIDGGCTVDIASCLLSLAQGNPSVTLSNGTLTINSGYMWDGVTGVNAMIRVTGGNLDIKQMRFDSSTARAVAYLIQTAGSVRVSDSVFVIPPTPGAAGFVLTDNAMNAIVNVEFNGWLLQGIGPLGRYENRGPSTVTYTNGASFFTEADTPTTAQLTLSPTSINAKEGKLRLMGAFPVGTDTAPRIAASLRAGFVTTSWGNPYLDTYIANQGNDTGDDANMVRMLRLYYQGGVLGYGTTTANTVWGLDGPHNLTRSVRYTTLGVPRFDILVSGGESSGNAGGNFYIYRSNDAGNTIDAPFSITRSTGAILMATLQTSASYANDAAAATGGVPVGGLYRNGSVVQVRVA
jgi:hypothetical protein